MYQRKYVLRYGDIDRFANAKVGTIFDILQDISTRHSEAIGFDMNTLYKMNIAFLLKGWRIKLIQPFNYYSDIVAYTGIMKIRHFETVRKYEFYQDGILKLVATGNWMPVNIETKKIVVCPDEIKNAYDCINEENNDFEFVRLRQDEDAVFVMSYDVQKRDIDTNGHVNNVKSVELSMEVVPEDFKTGEIQVNYVSELKKNESIKIYAKSYDDTYRVELKNSELKSCVLVNIKKD